MYKTLLDHISRMTAERDPVALGTAFVTALQATLNLNGACLYSINRTHPDRVTIRPLAGSGALAASSAELPLSPEHRALIQESLDTQRHTYTTLVQDTGHKLAILPLGQHQHHALLLTGPTLQPEQTLALEALLSIYCNCYGLVNDNLRDMLTGLLNRKSFVERIGQISKILARSEHSGALKTDQFTLATLDIDYFKRVNDQFGHVVGDEILILFADLMRRQFRDTDLLFRFGGEEFVVVLCFSDFDKAHLALDRFRKAVEHYAFPQVGRVTVSIGYARINAGELPTQFIERADQALYFAKENGRNQIRCFEELQTTGLVSSSQHSGDVELF